MDLEHFGLRERPFSNAPDLRFVYLGAHHEQALAYLRHGMEAQEGIIVFTGERGTGKTTTCRVLLNRLPERVDVALILNPVLTPLELLTVVCDELGVTYGMDASNLAVLRDALYRELAARRGTRRTVVIVDEAQNLDLDVLGQLCFLSNLEIDGRKLLKILLIGEPGLLERLGRTTLHPPSHATTGYYLLPLAEDETCAYVRHRLAIAGGRDVFEAEALRDVHHLSSGVPRLINTICDRALSSAVAQRRRIVDRSTVRAAARSVLGPASSPALEAREEAPPVKRVAISREPSPARRAARARRPLWPWLVSGGLVLGAVAIGAAFLGQRPADVGAPEPDTHAEAKASTSVDPPPAPTAPEVADPPRGSQPDVIRRAETAPQLDTARPTEEPVLAARPTAPALARRAAPAMSVAPEPSGSTVETPRQKRRRARNELPATASPAPASDRALPPQELKIDMLVWAAEPRERMVYVNGHKYVEGETLENGSVLQRIEQDGIVVIQEGQRLRVRSEAR